MAQFWRLYQNMFREIGDAHGTPQRVRPQSRNCFVDAENAGSFSTSRAPDWMIPSLFGSRRSA
jgi:hypothetical protein